MSADDNSNTPPPEDPNQPPVIETPGTESGGAEASQNFSFDEPMPDAEESELTRSGSSLGGGSGKAITFGAALLLGTGVILYYLFSDSPPPPPPPNAGAIAPTKPSGEIISQPATAPPANIGISPPTAPAAPPAPPPPPPPPPPAPPAVVRAANAPPPAPPAPLAPPDIKAIAPTEPPKGVIDQAAAARMRSNMLLMNSTGGSATAQKQEAERAINANDPNAAFTSNAIEASQADTVQATKLNNLNKLIAQGKIINAVLETAINTDLPGTLRAVISRDIYGEAGREVLIPKGSRLIGTYNTSVFRGQKRVLIVWTRVITPEGMDIMIGSPAIDSLGRAGVEGVVDNKFMESFSAALLTSLISVGIAVAADATISDGSTTTSNTDGSSTTTGSAGAAAANSSVKALGGVGTQVVSTMLDLRPTITVDQGTRVNVFVNRDLVMPGKESSGSMFIQ